VPVQLIHRRAIRSFAAAAAAAALLGSIPPSYGAPFTQIAFTETDLFFSWDFSWDKTLGPDFTPTRPAGQTVQWTPLVRARLVVDEQNRPLGNGLLFDARHVVRPEGVEHALDDPQGSPTPPLTFFRELSAGGGEFATLFDVIVRHDPDHRDRYRASSKVQGDLIVIAFSGRHEVPEPSTILLLATGFMSAAVVLWKRHRSK
jgi:PEP-CTERM motif